jgi:Glucose-6-phosphate dehydrogenase, C-terminal domain
MREAVVGPGVLFYLRTGKRLAQRVTEIAIQFKRAPHLLFRDTAVESLSANQFVMHIQPDEGISLRFSAKIPGAVMNLGSVNMNMKYEEYFGATPWIGYETLLPDCMIGDPTLFQRADMVEAGWRVVAPLLDVWKALPPREFPNYTAGSWGPTDADHMLERAGTASPRNRRHRHTCAARDKRRKLKRKAVYVPEWLTACNKARTRGVRSRQACAIAVLAVAEVHCRRAATRSIARKICG